MSVQPRPQGTEDLCVSEWMEVLSQLYLVDYQEPLERKWEELILIELLINCIPVATC